ncbi:MAG: L-seryl-tRNA(Sec) selenium transferase, partial [Verrucomicrobiota bacterium]
MSCNQGNPLSRIPAVEKVLHALGTGDGAEGLPRPLVASVVREEIDGLRERVRQVDDLNVDFDSVVASIRARLTSLERSRIRPVINGTGVIIHTNLGRIPMSAATVESMNRSGRFYNSLEFDLGTGERGARGGFLERCLGLICEAEAATVVNNCASALVLMLKHLAKGERNEVIISRGELIEIGGGFRVPDILEASGAVLREVGATNKTSLQDYAAAIGPRTGMILKVHRSNFYQEGFVDEAELEELVALGRDHDLPVVEDLGSGAMIPTESLAPIPHEPTVAERLRRGLDLVCVSGDKLMGGPQAGIIAGRADLVAGLKQEPFFRALRCDKLILSGLEQVAIEYLGGGEVPDLPLTQMLAARVEEDLRPRAERIHETLKPLGVRIGEGVSRCGGGTMPKAEIPSLTLDIH